MCIAAFHQFMSLNINSFHALKHLSLWESFQILSPVTPCSAPATPFSAG
jgi:hypothetical protein